MDQERALTELYKLLDEFSSEIDKDNETHADAYQAVGFAILIIEQGVE